MPRQAFRLFLILALLGAVAVAPVVTRAAAAGADLVFEAIQVLDEEYVDQTQIDRVRLLNVALDGIKATLNTAGITAKFAAIPAGTPRAEAEKVFRGAFDGAVLAAQGKVTAQGLAYAAVQSITLSLNDSHTGFITPDQYRERLARQRQQAGFSGVGMVVLPKDSRFYVWEVIPRSPAAQKGVHQFDRIVRINDVLTGGLTTEQVVSMIRGPAGSSVTVTFERAGRAGSFPLILTRAPIVVPAVLDARMVDPRIGYIYLYEFSQGSSRDLRRAVQELLGKGARALILDLRSNNGGYLHELDAIMNLLLPRGLPVYRSITSRGTQVVRTSRTPVLPPQQPLVVLVNEGTASAAELLTAAVAEHQRGAVIGMKTAGAVEASTLIELSDGSAMSVTIRRLTSGKGRRLEGTGVEPEVTLDLSADDFLQARDAQLERGAQIIRQRLSRAASAPASPVPAGR